MAPYGNLLHPGTLVYLLVFLVIGMAFGAILEMSGSGIPGNSRRSSISKK